MLLFATFIIAAFLESLLSRVKKLWEIVGGAWGIADSRRRGETKRITGSQRMGEQAAALGPKFLEV